MAEAFYTIESLTNSTNFLTYTYYNKPDGMNYTMLTNGEVIKTPPTQEVPSNYKQFVFGKNNKRITLKWNPDDTDDAGSRERAYLLQHFRIKCDTFAGNMNLTVPGFKMIDHYTEDIQEYDRLLSVTAMTNKILAMDGKQLSDVLYYFGLDATGMSMRKMILKLIAPQEAAIANEKVILGGGGILLEVTDQYDRSKEFHTVFGSLTDDTARVINIRKAIALNIIAIDGDMYKFGGEVLSDSIDGVLAYYKGNTERYERFLKPQVEAKINEVHPNDLDRQPEKELAQSFAPVVAKAAEVKVEKYTQKDWDELNRQILLNDQNAELKKDKNRYLSVQTSLKMRRAKVKKYMDEQSTAKQEREHGTFSNIEALTKQGTKQIKKQEQQKEKETPIL